MRVFISWAKDERSRVVASALRDWLPDFIQTLEPWTSATDIDAGTRWSAEMTEALTRAKIGILCVTASNQREPWLLFEAGALARSLDNTFVCPYLIEMQPGDLTSGPLLQFQSKTATREGTFELVSTINRALGPNALPLDRLTRLFDVHWPTLEAQLADLAQLPTSAASTQSEMLTEILEAVRSLARRLPTQPVSRQEHRSRLDRSQAASGIVEVLARSGHLSASWNVQVRRLLARLPPPDLESVRHMVHAAAAADGVVPDATFQRVLKMIGVPADSREQRSRITESNSAPVREKVRRPA